MHLFENQFESNFARAEDLDWENLFNGLDTNGDGQISYGEFLTGATDMTRLINRENLKVAFDLLDLDGDGNISIDELQKRFAHSNFKGHSQGLSKNENKGESYWVKMIAEMDEDNDGFITFDEFYNNMFNLLSQALMRRSSVVDSSVTQSLIESQVPDD